MHRVSVVGVPASGKTTVGRRLAASFGVPFVELDAIFHQPGWVELPVDDFRKRVTEALTAPAWVVDGNYSAVRDLVWQRADTVVWLDLPRRRVMYRIILRTVRRALTRERLWNGNREPLSNFYRLDPTKNIIRWTWVKYADYIERYGAAMQDPAYSHLTFVRLRSQHEVGCVPSLMLEWPPNRRSEAPGPSLWDPHCGTSLQYDRGPDRGQPTGVSSASRWTRRLRRVGRAFVSSLRGCE
jgi:adenylate kinase family enzyme